MLRQQTWGARETRPRPDRDAGQARRRPQQPGSPGRREANRPATRRPARERPREAAASHGCAPLPTQPHATPRNRPAQAHENSRQQQRAAPGSPSPRADRCGRQRDSPRLDASGCERGAQQPPLRCVRRTTLRDPCADARQEWRAPPGYACAAGTRGSWPGAGYSAGTSACSPITPRSRCQGTRARPEHAAKGAIGKASRGSVAATSYGKGRRQQQLSSVHTLRRFTGQGQTGAPVRQVTGGTGDLERRPIGR
jgi:hypothetical protein